MKYETLKQEKLFIETGALISRSSYPLHFERMVMI